MVLHVSKQVHSTTFLPRRIDARQINYGIQQMGAAEKQKYLNRAEGRSENRGGVQSIIAGLMYDGTGFAPT